MTALYRVRTSLTGFTGGPGVSTMYFLDKQTAVASVRSFWASMASAIPSVVLMQVESSGDIIESTNGALTGTWTSADVAAVQGTNVNTYVAPAGAVISWLTGTVVGRKRLRGRTFIVPLSVEAFQSGSGITPAAQTIFTNAAQALLFEQSLSLAIWSRPRAAKAADGSRPAVTARLGSHGLVTGYRVPDLQAVLRSRRD